MEVRYEIERMLYLVDRHPRHATAVIQQLVGVVLALL